MIVFLWFLIVILSLLVHCKRIDDDDDDDEHYRYKQCTPFRGDARTQCAPHFICIGAPKAGTRTLRTLLSLHPQVRMASTELDFWNSANRPLKEYADALPRVLINESFTSDGLPLAVGEKSTWYYTHASAQRMRTRLPDVRILFLLRDPVERSFSQYVETLRERGTRRGKYLQAVVPHHASFDAALRFAFYHLERTHQCGFYPAWTIKHPNFDLNNIRHCVNGLSAANNEPFASPLEVKWAAARHDPMLTSAYLQFVEHWHQVFPIGRRMLVITSEEFFADLPGTLANVTAFLGLAPVDWRQLLASNRRPTNEKAGDKQELLEREGLPSEMTLDERELLASFFAVFNRRLESMLGRTFQNWTRASF
jgi:hypothetical protein